MSRARIKTRVRAIVEAAFSEDIRDNQERIARDCLRRHIVGDTADLVLATTPIDIMVARRVVGPPGITLSSEHQRAAEWFLRLYQYRNGSCRLKGALYPGCAGGDTNPSDPFRDAQALALMTDRRLSASDKNELVEVIVFHHVPRWLSQMINGNSASEDMTVRNAFVLSLDVLRTIWIEFDRKSETELRTRYERFRKATNT